MLGEHRTSTLVEACLYQYFKCIYAESDTIFIVAIAPFQITCSEEMYRFDPPLLSFLFTLTNTQSRSITCCSAFLTELPQYT